MTQLNLFSKEEPLWTQLSILEEKQEKLRKGLFKRYGALLSLVESLQQEVLEMREEMRNIESIERPA